MKQIRLEGRSITLTDRQVIGQGGEATIFQHQGQALKVYLRPEAARAAKLLALLPLAAGLPPQVIAPQQPVYDAAGQQVIGFAMRLLSAEYAEVRQLASRKQRALTGLTVREVARLFYRAGHTLAAIHQAGMVVGDLNDLNLMFGQGDMLFIDVDSFQFGAYPCMVGTEAFIDPALYNRDLAAAPYFRPEHDWYSFAVLAFKSLLLAHPYGGVHPTTHLLTQRAQQRLSVFSHQVTYPKIAFPLELLNDDLLYTFEAWFGHGQRGVFPFAALLDYAGGLQTCAFCGEWYPAQRPRCPHCAAVAPAAVVRQSVCQVLLRTAGKLVAWQVEDDTARLIAHEQGRAVLYTLNGQTPAPPMPLFEALPAAAYAFLGEVLVISPAPDSAELLLVDTAGDRPVPLLQTTTGAFGNGERVFGAGGGWLYRLANGYLLRGQLRYGQLVEQAVMAISEGQTWLRVSPDGATVFGYFRVFDSTQFWLLHGRTRLDLALSPLAAGEYMVECSVEFGEKSLLILRLTQWQGRERLCLDEIDLQGQSLHTEYLTDTADFTPLDAPVYARDWLLVATDAGIVRRRLSDQTRTTFTQTESVVRSGDRLYRYGRGLLIPADDRVLYVTP
ncbi:MAG: hypothetical protein MUE40_08830 [Anaerolineae bacterium]|nr:hypothetical protein [Anaerolineae bacterium]